MKKQNIFFSLALSCLFSALNAAKLQKITIQNDYQSAIEMNIKDNYGRYITINSGNFFDLTSLPTNLQIRVKNSPTWHSGIQNELETIKIDAKQSSHPLVVGIITIPKTSNILHFKYNTSVLPAKPPLTTEILVHNDTNVAIELVFEKAGVPFSPRTIATQKSIKLYQKGDKTDFTKAQVTLNNEQLNLMPFIQSAFRDFSHYNTGKHLRTIGINKNGRVTLDSQDTKD
jgi:hypothetical protein